MRPERRVNSVAQNAFLVFGKALLAFEKEDAVCTRRQCATVIAVGRLSITEGFRNLPITFRRFVRSAAHLSRGVHYR